jgi:thiol:disulfide interchange protein DsbC
MIAVLLIAVATVAFSGNAAKTAKRKSSGSPPDRKMIHDCASCHSISKEEAGTIFKGLGEVKSVKMSPVKGLYEVTVQQNNRQAVAYLDFGKKLLVPGPVFDIASKQPLTPPPVELPKILSKAEMDTIPLANSIVMGNPNGKKRIFVFTDPECPFCGRLHAELKKLIALEPDLTIYIKMYPLDMHPNAFGKARVLLSANSLELLDKAFAGEKLPEPGDKDPREPVDETIKLGKTLGIDGTPAIVLPDGRMISGTRDVKTLRGMLSEGK